MTDEIDALLRDRFDLSRTELILALRMLPASAGGTASLEADEARLLDRVGFEADSEAFAKSAAEVLVLTARLIKTAYGAEEVADGTGVDESVVEQRRKERTLWALNDNGSWVYPSAQFNPTAVDGRAGLSLIRGLDRVFPALPSDLHPVVIAGFLMTTQEELAMRGRPCTVRGWLNGGGAVESVLQLIEIREWVSN